MKLIIGLGETGFSCARYFSRKNIPFQIADTRTQPPLLSQFIHEFPDVPLQLGYIDETRLNQADEIILSPGVSPHLPLFKTITKKRLSDVELFTREAIAPIIAITGSNAKGTVTTLVGNMLHQAGLNALVGGNIGTPCLDLLEKPKPDAYVLELSSFQLETTYSLKPHAAAILNISPDHLDRHGTLENYITAKQRIYHHCEYAIYNGDDVATRPITPCPKTIAFGLSTTPFPFHLLNENHQTFLAIEQTPVLNVEALKIRGKHNWANALAALALGSTMNLPLKAMCDALTAFPGLPHRCQWIGSFNSIPWYDDSKGTNIGATLAAIEGLGPTFSGKMVLIAGGLGKGADFALLQNAVSHYVKAIVLLGQDAALIANALKNQTKLHFVNAIEEAVMSAKEIAQPGDAVLLSPACASLDMFKDYHDRGEKFVAAFKKHCCSHSAGHDHEEKH